MSEKMNRDFKYWIRWVFVLPISFLVGFLVDFPVHFVLYSTLSGGENPIIYPYPKFPELLLAPFFRALTFMWVCSKLTPEYKLTTAIVFAAIWIFGAGGGFFLSYIGFQDGISQFNLVTGGLPIIFGVIGVILGLFINNKELMKSNHTNLNF
jgi:hypothetical protein